MVSGLLSPPDPGVYEMALGVSVLMLPCTGMWVLILGAEEHGCRAMFLPHPIWLHMVPFCSNTM